MQPPSPSNVHRSSLPTPRRRGTLLRLVGLLALLVPLSVGSGAGTAHADTASAPAVATDQHGLAVVGLGSSMDAAWPLARAVYADASLRPTTLDEAHARVLVGEAPGEAGTPELRDLADTRAAIHGGDDAASRRLLSSIALSLRVKGILVVEPPTAPDGHATARVFVTAPGAYDPVTYDSDIPAPVTWGNGKSAVTWNGAVQAIRRGFADVPNAPPSPAPAAVIVAPSLATHPVDAKPLAVGGDTTDQHQPARAFYQSPWFWAAAGAALFAAGAVYFATRNDGSDNVQLQVQVPK
jgi:SAM-dependent methyltransferase